MCNFIFYFNKIKKNIKQQQQRTHNNWIRFKFDTARLHQPKSNNQQPNYTVKGMDGGGATDFDLSGKDGNYVLLMLYSIIINFDAKLIDVYCPSV